MLRIFSWMKTKIRHISNDKIIPYTFALSDGPMLFRDLLKTNKMYQEGLKLEGKIPGFRLSIGRSYLVFIALWHLILLPASALLHTVLAKIDCHLLILMAILFTGMFFATYAIFKEYLIDTVALKIIKTAWENHFPHFDYDLHAKEVAKIYSEALEKEIPHKNMQLYILDRLVEMKK
ncbi:MAG: hypothetical protein A2552_08575 [Sulfuricurvum sp. RIFOXYD2_FULL_44_160]|jgi:hypothetical protein|uniref:Uncharacterized protein n=1 Tax=Sulfuricurvum kujiense TaxID=148813 RepID=A0A2D3WDM5_9BACT|nr:MULTISPECIES: hypothetical protein [Sulfuricurvum]OHD91346.1 MAG: hypothetical protein A2517_00825 [Sulfuricurvum sp. RIFOXYD12_FULL_44_77]OHD92042.1 MAG: hypothetical protein A2552_08575 [Sulfuricurvum sp. RIFOXYD2_FULL_44_160]DAB39392.1 MAG TPA: hypothetical protein CFH83_00970 [Sulfuricurvum kujiense]